MSETTSVGFILMSGSCGLAMVAVLITGLILVHRARFKRQYPSAFKPLDEAKF